MATTVHQNGDNAALTGQLKEVPTLESIQKDAAALFEAQQNEISHLKKLLEFKETEIGELKTKCMKLLSEKLAADRELRSLKAQIETDGVRSDPAAGDGDSHRDDKVRLSGQYPESYKSAQEPHSSQLTKDSNDQYSLQQGAGKATAAAAAAAAITADSQVNAYSSLKSKGSKTMGESTVDMNDLVTLDMVGWLAENISIKEWKPLLRKLGVKDLKIEDVIHANQNNIQEQRYQGFIEWKKTSRSKGTVSSLLSAMEKLSLQQNIREFREEFKVKRGPGSRLKQTRCVELTAPYLKEKFDQLADGLRRLNNLSELQCVSLQYTPTPEAVREGTTVLSALEKCSRRLLQKYPGDKTERLRELQEVLKVCGTGVRAEFKKFVHAGVVGPLDGEKDLRDSRTDIRSKVEEMLSVNYEGTKNWKDLTSWLKEEHGGVFEDVDTYKINLWEKDKEPRTGARNIIQIWTTTTQATEGKLYAWLVQNGRNDIAKLLE